GAATAQGSQGPLAFTRVKSVADLEARVKAAGKPVMLDFYADWCVSCKEMERFTFADARVRARLAGFTLLQADVTANSEDDKALLQRFNLFGPPGIMFFDAAGQEVPGLRVVGFQDAERFLGSLGKVPG
ncbi:MAG TPA: thioredoxin family protein, partial [Azospira sp.]|nr:thioredoxin family protein [Azospira sp.]